MKKATCISFWLNKWAEGKIAVIKAFDGWANPIDFIKEIKADDSVNVKQNEYNGWTITPKDPEKFVRFDGLKFYAIN